MVRFWGVGGVPETVLLLLTLQARRRKGVKPPGVSPSLLIFIPPFAPQSNALGLATAEAVSPQPLPQLLECLEQGGLGPQCPPCLGWTSRPPPPPPPLHPQQGEPPTPQLRAG